MIHELFSLKRREREVSAPSQNKGPYGLPVFVWIEGQLEN